MKACQQLIYKLYASARTEDQHQDVEKISARIYPPLITTVRAITQAIKSVPSSGVSK